MPRESIACGTAGTDALRIASPMPGTRRSQTAAVASGVRSVGVSPVPPVVTTNSMPGSAHTARSSSVSCASPSGTTSRRTTV